MKQLCRLIADYMGPLVLATAAIALCFPSLFQGIKATVINPLLGVVMLGMGMTLKMEDLRIIAKRPGDILAGLFAQYTIMPFLAWVICHILRLDEPLAIGVILVGCSPGGTASNVITYLARGDLALSVGMTTASTLLAPIATPLLVSFMAGKTVYVDVGGMLLTILCVVIVPVAIGLTLKQFFPKASAQANVYMPALSTIAIATIIAIIIAANAQKIADCGALILAAVILHNTGGLTIGYLFGRLLGCNPAKCKALSIEVGMQNSGLATSLATLHFPAYPLATVPGAIFSVWHNLSGAIVARFFRTEKLTEQPPQAGSDEEARTAR